MVEFPNISNSTPVPGSIYYIKPAHVRIHKNISETYSHRILTTIRKDLEKKKITIRDYCEHQEIDYEAFVEWMNQRFFLNLVAK